MNSIVHINWDKSKHFKYLLIVLLATMLLVSIIGVEILSITFCQPAIADTVVYGSIHTVENNKKEVVEAYAIKDGEYIYVGDREGVKEYIKEGITEIIDADGQEMLIRGEKID